MTDEERYAKWRHDLLAEQFGPVVREHREPRRIPVVPDAIHDQGADVIEMSVRRAA